jgi:hypothetical protein
MSRNHEFVLGLYALAPPVPAPPPTVTATAT